MTTTQQKQSKEVLCVHYSDFIFDANGSPQGIAFDMEHAFHVSDIVNLATEEPMLWCDKDASEKDPSTKQIIPYAILTNGGKILSYLRGKKGGERRLHSKLSIGIGGHVEREDASIKAALAREIKEETGLDCEIGEPVAIVNDDSNDVGAVHLGFVYVVPVTTQDIDPEKGCINYPAWITPEAAKDTVGDYEPWSAMCIGQIERLLEGVR